GAFWYKIQIPKASGCYMKPRLLFLSGLVAAVTFAQSNLGSISGVVSDSQGAVMPAAKVAMTNVETGVINHAVSNGAGFYAIPSLPVGSYTLSVEHEGFRRYVRDGITLSTGQTLGVDVKMEIGAVSEVLNVREETPLMETRSSDFSTIIDPRSV